MKGKGRDEVAFASPKIAAWRRHGSSLTPHKRGERWPTGADAGAGGNERRRDSEASDRPAPPNLLGLDSAWAASCEGGHQGGPPVAASDAAARREAAPGARKVQQHPPLARMQEASRQGLVPPADAVVQL